MKRVSTTCFSFGLTGVQPMSLNWNEGLGKETLYYHFSFY